MIILLIFGFMVTILNIYFVFDENAELIVYLIVPFDLWTIKLVPHKLSLYVNEF